MKKEGAEITELVGKIFTAIERAEREGNDALIFVAPEAEYLFTHEQDCCESVRIEDVSGDLADLVGTPITKAEERHQDGAEEAGDDSATWTFYEFATNKGSVTVRWYGESNGYYSEQVDLVKVTK